MNLKQLKQEVPNYKEADVIFYKNEGKKNSQRVIYKLKFFEVQNEQQQNDMINNYGNKIGKNPCFAFEQIQRDGKNSEWRLVCHGSKEKVEKFIKGKIKDNEAASFIMNTQFKKTSEEEEIEDIATYQNNQQEENNTNINQGNQENEETEYE